MILHSKAANKSCRRGASRKQTLLNSRRNSKKCLANSKYWIQSGDPGSKWYNDEKGFGHLDLAFGAMRRHCEPQSEISDSGQPQKHVERYWVVRDFQPWSGFGDHHRRD